MYDSSNGFPYLNFYRKSEQSITLCSLFYAFTDAFYV